MVHSVQQAPKGRETLFYYCTAVKRTCTAVHRMRSPENLYTTPCLTKFHFQSSSAVGCPTERRSGVSEEQKVVEWWRYLCLTYSSSGSKPAQLAQFGRKIGRGWWFSVHLLCDTRDRYAPRSSQKLLLLSEGDRRPKSGYIFCA